MTLRKRGSSPSGGCTTPTAARSLAPRGVRADRWRLDGRLGTTLGRRGLVPIPSRTRGDHAGTTPEPGVSANALLALEAVRSLDLLRGHASDAVGPEVVCDVVESG